jgi:hypothetical protein
VRIRSWCLLLQQRSQFLFALDGFVHSSGSAVVAQDRQLDVEHALFFSEGYPLLPDSNWLLRMLAVLRMGSAPRIPRQLTEGVCACWCDVHCTHMSA